MTTGQNWSVPLGDSLAHSNPYYYELIEIEKYDLPNVDFDCVSFIQLEIRRFIAQ